MKSKLLSKLGKKLQKKLSFSNTPKGQEEKLGNIGEIPEKIKISNSLETNLETIKKVLGDSLDINLRRFKIGKGKGIEGAAIWLDGLVENKIINDNIIKNIMEGTESLEIPIRGGGKEVFEQIAERHLSIGDIKQVNSLSDVIYGALSGDTIFFLDRFPEAIVASTRGWVARGIEEPASEVVIRGPREGFTETLITNTSLLRRRLKNPNLRIESFQLGRQSQTDVALVYVKGIVNEEVLEELKRRIKRIDTDVILESSYIEEMIEDAPFSIFPTMVNTERPDALVGSLLEGRVGIMVDGTPFVLIVPTIFFQLFQTPEDYFNRYPLATFSRWLRLMGLAVTLLLPATYIAVTTFHPEMLPTTLLLTIAASREGIPFPAFVEALIMEITFEVLREAGVRMPRPVGQAVSIVGALVIGDAAISAGIVSPPMVVIVAATAIASFLIPNPEVVGSVRLLRFGMMLLAASMGLYGITIGLLFIHIHLVSLRSFGIPFMWPIAPFNLTGLRDVLVRVPHWGFRFRPDIFTWQGQERQRSGNNRPRKPK
ncbi:spore germination protein KA [Desulfitispora alkaliphila]|uniref:spore germination protein n=1 Tax=Desulfitispora alkaliphila TaxID=622674 RepID=UPI003D21A581